MVTTAYPNLEEHLRSWGLKVVPVSGWKTRSANSTTFTPQAVLCHHTAGAATGNAPSLRYITDNVLSQFVLGRDGTVHIVSGNRCNHAGVGGPLRGIPKDAGNRYTWGIEAENTGRGEPWPAVQLEAYYKLAAALCDMHRVDQEAVFAHKEWAPTRKTDPNGITMSSFRAEVAKRLSAGKGGFVADPVLRIGDSGQAVTNLQNALVKHKFLVSGQVDGDFGPTTEKALKAFQSARKLIADGVCGPATWAALRKAPPAAVVVPAPAPQVSTGGKRMLVQFKGDNYVYEVVGSSLIHVSADAWRARGLTSANVTIVDPAHPLSKLPRKNEY